MPRRSRAQNSVAGVCVPDGESEHAAEAAHACRAIFFVGVEDGFGVAVRWCSGGRRASRRGAERGVVENLAVVDDPERARPRWSSAGGRRRRSMMLSRRWPSRACSSE